MTRARAATIAIVIAQVLVIASFAARHEYRRHSWEPVRLRAHPIDPVSLFRGRYVRLSYDWSFEADTGEWERDDTIYLRLAPGADEVWRVVERGKSLARRPGTVVLRGRVHHFRPEGKWVTAAGGRDWEGTGKGEVVISAPAIESFFLSKRKALLIDRLPGELPREKREMTVDVAVSPSGDSQLVQLYVDGIPAEDFELPAP